MDETTTGMTERPSGFASQTMGLSKALGDRFLASLYIHRSWYPPQGRVSQPNMSRFKESANEHLI